MRKIAFEIPTMTGKDSRKTVLDALKKIGAACVRIETGKAEVTFNNPVKKVDLIIAIEETGNVVKY